MRDYRTWQHGPTVITGKAWSQTGAKLALIVCSAALQRVGCHASARLIVRTRAIRSQHGLTDGSIDLTSTGRIFRTVAAATRIWRAERAKK